MIKDLKSIIKSQKKIKINHFDKKSLTNLSRAVKEQWKWNKRTSKAKNIWGISKNRNRRKNFYITNLNHHKN